MLSLEKFLFDRYSIEIMLKKFHGKLNSELMHKSYAKEKSSDKFSKRKLYI